MIAVIDYRAGNLTSVRLSLESLGAPARVTNRPEDILAAERVIFPGVGAARSAMRNLRDLGLVDPIRTVVRNGVPFLGICLGTQIVFERSREDGGVDGLGLIPGDVVRFDPAVGAGKVPHMGWNSVRQRQPHPLFKGLADNSEFYFVHSYFPVPADDACVIGETDYGGLSFASVVAASNLVATQFHPEKSGRLGLKMLENFVAWRPASMAGGLPERGDRC